MGELKDFLYIGRTIEGASFKSLRYKSSGKLEHGFIIVIHVMTGDRLLYRKDRFNKLFSQIEIKQ